jgi:hypothetical protein
MKFTTFVISMLGAAFLPFSIAAAEPIAYAFSGTATGTLAGVPFSNLSLTVTAVSDTADVPAPDAEGIIIVPATKTIVTDSASLFATVADGQVFENQEVPDLGFDQTSSQFSLISFTGETFFTTYNLLSSAGPISESENPEDGFWTNMPTSAGALTVNTFSNVTFTATLGSTGPSGPTSGPPAVPLPSTAGLSLAGLAICAIAAYRRSVPVRRNQA